MLQVICSLSVEQTWLLQYGYLIMKLNGIFTDFSNQCVLLFGVMQCNNVPGVQIFTTESSIGCLNIIELK